MRTKVLLALLICIAVLVSSDGMATAQLNPSNGHLVPAKDVGIEALELISFKNSFIAQSSSQEIVVVEGFTSSQFAVDYLTVTLYLERWNGSKWTTVGSKTFSASNTSYVDGMYYTSVQKGERYRVKGYHSATNGNISEAVYTYTNAIEIK